MSTVKLPYFKMLYKIMRVLFCVALCLGLTFSSKGSRKGCFNKAELEMHGKPFLRKHLLRSGFKIHVPDGVQKRDHETHTCENFKLKPSSLDLKNRALSPWKYRIDVDDNRYPARIAMAECLCEGCIIDGEQNHGYSSELVKQTVMVATITTCRSDPQKYSLQYVPLEVGVGCTCVIPRS
ncbi:interleukin-17C-like [Brienomyrus brachyistius]|uniref:interleukin-17C-like n=1 Tax=Brienomyrus brachyistius TaxID=42636 RepID=UPI0020B349CF|nr:interleukin-17C-like [Brienomyrus brachyistius]